MDAYNESRLRIFAAASVKFAVVKYILAAARTKFGAARIFRIKGSGVQPESTSCSKNISRCSETCCPDMLEHKTLGYKRGPSSHFQGRKRERMTRT